MTFRIIKHKFVGISTNYCGVGRIVLEAIKKSGHSTKHQIRLKQIDVFIAVATISSNHRSNNP